MVWKKSEKIGGYLTEEEIVEIAKQSGASLGAGAYILLERHFMEFYRRISEIERKRLTAAFDIVVEKVVQERTRNHEI